MSEREQVRVDQSPVRCPFCHEDVQVSEADWVACAACLARHHGECWSEAGRCGACGAGEALARASGPAAPAVAPAAPPPEPDTLGRLVPWAGAPKEVTFARTIEGEVGEDTDEVVVTEARRRLGLMGRFERLGRTLTWTTRGTAPQEHGGRQITVTAAARDGRTTLEVTEDLSPPILGGRIIGVVFGILGFFLGFAGGVELMKNLFGVTGAAAGALGAALALAAVTVALFVARLAYTKAYRTSRPQLSALTDALERELRARVRRKDPKAQ